MTPLAPSESLYWALSQILLSEGFPRGGVSTSDPMVFFFESGRVRFALTVGAEEGDHEALKARLEAKIKALEGVEDVQIILTSEKPPAKPVPSPSRPPPPRPKALPGVRASVAIASGKGGVGKSTTAVNIALACAGLGKRVGLLDADIYGPSIPHLLAISEKPPSLGGGKMKPVEKHGLSVMSMGFFLEAETPVVWRGPMVMAAVRQMLQDVEWGDLDLLLIDMPPGTGDAALTLVQTIPLSGAVMVSTPQDLALLDARRGISMFEKVGVPLLGVIENMSYFTCQACGVRHDVFHHGGARDVAEGLGIPFLGEVPLVKEIRAQGDAGLPIVEADPTSLSAQTYRMMAQKIIEGVFHGA